MKQTIGFTQFVDAFHSFDRYEQFGYDALRLLFDYLEQYEEDSGEEMELDVIAICCDYAVDYPADIAANYSIDISDCEDDSEISETVTEYLEDHTQVIGATSDGQIVYLQF